MKNQKKRLIAFGLSVQSSFQFNLAVPENGTPSVGKWLNSRWIFCRLYDREVWKVLSE